MSTSIRLPQCIKYNVLRLWLEIFSLSSVRLYMLKYSTSGSWEKWLCDHLSVMFGALNVSILRLLQESRLISHCLVWDITTRQRFDASNSALSRSSLSSTSIDLALIRPENFILFNPWHFKNFMSSIPGLPATSFWIALSSAST